MRPSILAIAVVFLSGVACGQDVQPRAFTPELLGAFRVVPDFRVFELAADFRQAFLAGIEVKDTP